MSVRLDIFYLFDHKLSESLMAVLKIAYVIDGWSKIHGSLGINIDLQGHVLLVMDTYNPPKGAFTYLRNISINFHNQFLLISINLLHN